MSETFQIKKTAFSIYDAGSPMGSNSFLIGPGELNGPGGFARDSDLKLYGFGSHKWGEGVNQNLLRILENNACPGKITGDFLQDTDDPNDYVPGTGSYIFGTDPILPKDENDLGIGNGITVPFPGQNWFNTTNEIIYIYTLADGWSSAGEGAVFVGDVDMSSNVIFNLAPIGSPADPSFAISLGSADARYVNVIGDTMTGVLNMGTTNRIINVADPVDDGDVVNLGYADTNFLKAAGGDILTGDLTWAIVGSPIPNESAGLRWTGNTDYARMFVETYGGTESSRLIIEMGDNGDSQDYILFRSDQVGTTTDTLKLTSLSVESLVPFHANVLTAGSINASNLTTTGDITVQGDMNFGTNVSSKINSPDTNTRIEFYTGGTIRDIQLISNGSSGFAVRGNTTAGAYRLDAYVELDMNNNKISSVATPIYTGDAANKSYVDGKTSGAQEYGYVDGPNTFNTWYYLGQVNMQGSTTTSVGADINRDLTVASPSGTNVWGRYFAAYNPAPVNALAFRFYANSWTECSGSAYNIRMLIYPEALGQDDTGYYNPGTANETKYLRKETPHLKLQSNALSCAGNFSTILSVYCLLDGRL